MLQYVIIGDDNIERFYGFLDPTFSVNVGTCDQRSLRYSPIIKKPLYPE